MSERLQESSEALVDLQVEWGVALTRARASHKQCDESQFADWDREHCWDCEISIPAPRLAMGRVRCVECQTKIEKSKQM
jgi:RNA polymerase-binding transcription factor DksA